MDVVEKFPLFVDYVCNISEELIQLGHTLLNIPNLGLALYNQRILKIHLVLRGESQLFL
jgi:hypothetical protein